MDKIKINYIYSCNAWKKVDFDLKALTTQVSKLALKESDVTNHLNKVEFTLNLSDDEELKLLNSEFMGKDNPTNVLSFPSHELKVGNQEGYKHMDNYIGDIAVSFSRIHIESYEQNKELKNHYAHMIVHAILHLIGYDHQKEDEAHLMEAREIKILEALGIKNPYEI
jgi:probable rRNA maturation factor